MKKSELKQLIKEELGGKIKTLFDLHVDKDMGGDYQSQVEKKAALYWEFYPTEPVIVKEVIGSEGNYQGDITITLSNGDTIEYIYKKDPSSGKGLENVYLNRQKFAGNDLLDIGDYGGVIAAMLDFYAKAKKGKIDE